MRVRGLKTSREAAVATMRVLGLVVLAAVCVPALCSELAQGSAPLLMWSSTAALGSGARVDYEVGTKLVAHTSYSQSNF